MKDYFGHRLNITYLCSDNYRQPFHSILYTGYPDTFAFLPLDKILFETLKDKSDVVF